MNIRVRLLFFSWQIATLSVDLKVDQQQVQSVADRPVKWVSRRWVRSMTS